MANYTYSNELYHHGILGMKWGVRRFQNKDGSLTSAGRKRKKSLLKYETRPSNRSTSIFNNEKSRAQTVAESRKEAAATVKFYGGKNVAKRATEDEYRNVGRKNAIRYGVKGSHSIGASAVGAILANEGAYTIGALMMGGGAGALAVTTVGAFNAARILNHNKNMKVSYIQDINVNIPKVDDDDK